MTATAVKMLFSRSHGELEQQLNQWLEQISGQGSITGISMDSNEYGHCIALMYQIGGTGRFYRGHLFFHSRHTVVESEANQGLQAADAQWGRFVALGSNQYGHCLCVIEEK